MAKYRVYLEDGYNPIVNKKGMEWYCNCDTYRNENLRDLLRKFVEVYLNNRGVEWTTKVDWFYGDDGYIHIWGTAGNGGFKLRKVYEELGLELVDDDIPIYVVGYDEYSVNHGVSCCRTVWVNLQKREVKYTWPDRKRTYMEKEKKVTFMELGIS